MDTSILTQELAPLNAQIEQARERLGKLEGELRAAEAEVETFSAEQQRFDVLRDICAALDRLGELGANELFWEGLPATDGPAEHLARLRDRVACFDEETREAREVRDSLQAMVDQQYDELDWLDEEVRQAYIREDNRQQEFLIEREISPIPYRRMIMPWTKGDESEKHFRKVLLVALCWSLVLGIAIPLVTVPIPDRASVVVEIPQRLAMLVKNEPPKQAPVPKKPREEQKPAPDQEKLAKTEPKADPKTKPGGEQKKNQQAKSQPAGGGGSPNARAKAETTGVLAFKSSFSDLMDEVPVARLGAEARLNSKVPQVAGQARATRSLVALQSANGGSSGISNYGVSRNLGNGGSDGGTGYGRGGGFGSGNGTGSGHGNGAGFGRVTSAVAGLTEEAGRPLSDGPGPGRTDEEIQIVFDRYKATLYRIYNKKLREDPTLRGKLLLRLIIEPGGEVSLCRAESTDLGSAELVAQIVDRVKKFNFGPKEGVPKTTILYPIDFLPAG